MKLSNLLEDQAFDDVDVIKIDPDRDDAYDIASKLLPTLTKIAYTYLLHDRKTHERKHGSRSDDEDAYNFSFTKEELKNRLEELVKHVGDKLTDQADKDFDATFQSVSKDFKDKVEE